MTSAGQEAGQSQFVYVTYMRATPTQLWDALTNPALTQRYWFGMHVESEWGTGAPWALRFADGHLADEGWIEEADRPRRLAICWRNVFRPELHEEGDSLCTMEIEPVDGAVKLTVTHRIAHAESKFIEAVSGGWPLILSNLKTLLETGEVLMPLKPPAQ